VYSIIPVELLQKVVDYLAGKPYREVHDLIPALINLEKIEEEERVSGETN